MFLSIGTLPRVLRRKPGNLVNVALLPKFLRRHHPKASTTREASLKRWLTWTSMRVVLRDLLESDDMGPVPGYRYVVMFLHAVLLGGAQYASWIGCICVADCALAGAAYTCVRVLDASPVSLSALLGTWGITPSSANGITAACF